MEASLEQQAKDIQQLIRRANRHVDKTGALVSLLPRESERLNPFFIVFSA
jgi:hypothetical protein